MLRQKLREWLLDLGGVGVQVVTIVVLLVVLLQTGYPGNSNFGASAFADYGTLAVAGLGTSATAKPVAGVVSRVVSTDS
jgi:hypothetical protein